MAREPSFQTQLICDYWCTRLLQNRCYPTNHRELPLLLHLDWDMSDAGYPFAFACHIFSWPGSTILPRLDYGCKVFQHRHAFRELRLKLQQVYANDPAWQ